MHCGMLICVTTVIIVHLLLSKKSNVAFHNKLASPCAKLTNIDVCWVWTDRWNSTPVHIFCSYVDRKWEQRLAFPLMIPSQHNAESRGCCRSLDEMDYGPRSVVASRLESENQSWGTMCCSLSMEQSKAIFLYSSSREISITMKGLKVNNLLFACTNVSLHVGKRMLRGVEVGHPSCY